MNNNRFTNLVQEAQAAMQQAYAPYSGFWVGAALLTTKNNLYRGCNVENASYSCTCCAERTALYKAISEGERSFSALAVVGGPQGVITQFCPPCGVCRQVLWELCPADLPIVMWDGTHYRTQPLSGLLPEAFSRNSP